MDWLGSNIAYTMFALTMLFVIIFIIYIKLYVRVFYEGTQYRHYRLGKLLEENDEGGTVFLIPFIDRLEVFDRETTESDEYFEES
jgi:regulator of protease activity HflC (stomatin/prohibitin superfamily)